MWNVDFVCCILEHLISIAFLQLIIYYVYLCSFTSFSEVMFFPGLFVGWFVCRISQEILHFWFIFMKLFGRAVALRQ